MVNYEKYRTIQTTTQFYKDWDEENYNNLTEDLKKTIYARYVIKSLVFQRDNFKCGNEGCEAITELTLHHIKFQKNQGKHTLKNCVCICHSCHQSYHRGKKPLILNDRTYKIHEFNTIDWKEIRRWGKEIRKGNRELYGITISWELMTMLLQWLNIHYEDMELEGDGL